jgi:two-component system, cell cycle sensor histidine kinase and response regulator CckA
MSTVLKQRILVVDDNEPGRYATCRLLRQAGYDVVEAATGAEALEQTAAAHPDLVLLDVRLPDINGLEVCGRIKAAPETSSTPVLQMSASVADATSRAAALDCGADGYIATPIDPKVLVATVRALLRLRLTEQKLHEAAVEWKATFDAIHDGVATLDMRGCIQRSNAALPAMLGLKPEDASGRNLDELIPPQGDAATIGKLLEAGNRFCVERLAGKRSYEISVDPMFDKNGNPRGGVAIISDITERKELNIKMREAQKLESIGLLAGGVAHDFNNLLMGILGNASLAIDLLDTPAAARSAMQDVIRATERAADLTKQLLAYAGKGRFVVGPVNLSSLVQELVPLIQAAIPRQVRLDLRLARDLPGIEADKAQLEQLAMNLIINAAEAIEGDGLVTVSTTYRRTIPPGDRAGFMSEHDIAGSYIALEVTDTGIGMDEQTRERIFDPFFSTKFLGRGLGLSAALGIVRGHNGAIRVKSTPGKGTTFEVMLPAATAVEAEDTRQPQTAAHGCPTVLVVDDEEIIRKLLVAALESRGYRVLLAENGAEALNIFSRSAQDISLVLLDLVMPVMSGESVLPHLFLMKPDIRVMVSSGQDPEECIRKLNEPRISAYLQKPYRVDILLSKMEAFLAGGDEVNVARG